MRTALVLALLTAVALCEESIIEKKHPNEEVYQLRNKRCAKFNCEENEDMGNTLRHVFLSAHNNMRESLTQGTEVGKKGFLPRASDMYKLMWSCALEVQARDWTRQCDNLQAANIDGLGQNFVVIENFSGDIPNTVAKTVGDWRSEVVSADLGDVIKYSTAFGIEHWANMANSATTEVGCSVHTCGTSLTLSCFYNKVGNTPNNVIYEQGTPCTFDYECSKRANSYCVPLTGLCQQRPKIDGAEEGSQGYSSYICPRNSKMTDTARHTVLDWHNAFRSNLAFGKEEDGEGSYAPMAKGMLKMHYDCILERTAQDAAEKCLFTPFKQGKIGENMFMTQLANTKHDQVTLLQQASKQWWDELKQGGVGYNNTFTRKELTNHLEHFTQMAWSATYRVGCATSVCGDKYYAVCHYTPRGNMYGQKVYTYGSPCKSKADCDVGQSCAAEEGMCVVTLE